MEISSNISTIMSKTSWGVYNLKTSQIGKSMMDLIWESIEGVEFFDIEFFHFQFTFALKYGLDKCLDGAIFFMAAF